MSNIGAPLGKNFETVMPSMTDTADIQRAFMMLWYGDANATEPTGRGIEAFLSDLSGSVSDLTTKEATEIIFAPSSPSRDAANYSSWIWVDTSRFNPDGASRPVYIWNGAWRQVAGVADPTANYTWTGKHTFEGEISASKATNSFATAAARAAAMPSPQPGTLTFVESEGRYEFFYNGSWVPVGSAELEIKTTSSANYTLVESDANKVLIFTSAGAATLTLGSNQIRVGSSIYVNRRSAASLTIVAGSGITLDGGAVSVGQNGSVVLTKIGASRWIVQGAGASLPPGGAKNQAVVKNSAADYDFKYVDIVPKSGGSFGGSVSIPLLDATGMDIPSGGLRIGGKRIYVQPNQPPGNVGDIWIQA